MARTNVICSHHLTALILLRVFFKKERVVTCGLCKTHRETRNVYTNLVGTPYCTRQLTKPMRRMEDNIKMLTYIRLVKGCEWIESAQEMLQ